MLLYSEGGTKAQESDAESILWVLCAAYPGHPWAVRVDGGVIFIRHLEFRGNWGMNCKWKDVSHDAAVLKREVIRMAGEWLERAGLVRGRNNDDEIIRVEGIPDRFQPQKPTVEFTTTVLASSSDQPLRTTPRPQAMKQD